MIKMLSTTLSYIGAVSLLCLSAGSVHASTALPNTVGFTQDTFNVGVGDNLTVDLIGSNFIVGPDGAGFSLAWDPTVLSYVGTSIANPPWDVSSINADSATSGLIDFVFLNQSIGNAGSDFVIASFTFNVIGWLGDSTSLMLSNDPYEIGFLDGLNSIDVNYVNSQVQVVPIPAAAWLFGSAMIGLFGSGRLRKPSGRDAESSAGLFV